jgi:hypothetical protein
MPGVVALGEGEIHTNIVRALQVGLVDDGPVGEGEPGGEIYKGRDARHLGTHAFLPHRCFPVARRDGPAPEGEGDGAGGRRRWKSVASVGRLGLHL